MVNLCEGGRKWGNDVSENLAPKFPSEGEAISLTPLPPPSTRVLLLPPPLHESAPLAHIFCLKILNRCLENNPQLASCRIPWPVRSPMQIFVLHLFLNQRYSQAKYWDLHVTKSVTNLKPYSFTRSYFYFSLQRWTGPRQDGIRNTIWRSISSKINTPRETGRKAKMCLLIIFYQCYSFI